MKTAEKTDKPAAKPAVKVFDVSHPGKSTPSSSARPVIVTNRPIMQDPMVSQPNESEQALPSKPLTRIHLKPLDEIEKDQPTVEDKPEATEPPVSPEPAAPTTEVAAASEEPGEVAALETAVEPPTDDKKNAAEDSKVEAEEAPAPEASDTDAAPDDDSVDGTPEEDGKNDDAKEDAETAALEAKVKQEEAVNALVDSREFFLPINSVERRRSKIIGILGLILIILLALVLLDLLMDVGTLKIPGVTPVTHFFSA